MHEDHEHEEDRSDPEDPFGELTPFWRGVVYGALGGLYYSWYDEP